MPVEELPENIQPLPVIVPWTQRSDAIPVKQSDLIVIGVATTGGALLSQNQSGIYTAYDIKPEEILKPPNATIPVLNVERPGGTIVFASGKTQRYGVIGQGNLLLNHRYALFIKRNATDQDYTLITAFELEGGHIHPVDGFNADFHLHLVFDEVERMTESEFLKRVNAQLGGK